MFIIMCVYVWICIVYNTEQKQLKLSRSIIKLFIKNAARELYGSAVHMVIIWRLILVDQIFHDFHILLYTYVYRIVYVYVLYLRLGLVTELLRHVSIFASFIL